MGRKSFWLENLKRLGRLGEQHVDFMLLLISTIRKGASEFGVDINGSKLG
jgi:hypothetical protein